MQNTSLFEFVTLRKISEEFTIIFDGTAAKEAKLFDLVALQFNRIAEDEFAGDFYVVLLD